MKFHKTTKHPLYIIVALFVLLISVNGCKFENRSSHSAKTIKEEKKALYMCPMHPHITSDKPGSCSICGMDLVPSEADGDPSSESSDEQHVHSEETPSLEDHAKIAVNKDKQELIGIKITTAIRRKLFKTIRAPGRAAFDPELYTAQSEYLEALKQWRRIKDSPIQAVKRGTREMIKSAKIRLKILGLSEGEITKLSRKGNQSEGLLFSGKDQENWIYADVFEMELPFIKKGQSVQITANFLQGKVLYGEVLSVDEIINPKTRTAKVRIQLKKDSVSLRAQSYVNVAILAPVGEHLTVPIDAIMDTGRETLVFIKTSSNKFEPRLVNIILETDNSVAIAGDVKAGDTIVVGGNFMLNSESRLKAVIKNSYKPNHDHSKKEDER